MADTLHGNGRSTVNMNATDMYQLSADSPYSGPSFDIKNISVAPLLTELRLFL